MLKRRDFKLENYTALEASNKAIEWCAKHPGWKRICDIEDTDVLYKNWEELPEKVRSSWIREYGEHSAESLWVEFGDSPCKVPFGFVTGKGEFYKNILDVPLHHNLMTVYKVN